MQGHILIVEDDTELAKLMSMYLEKEGFTTCLCPTAEAGQGALEHSNDPLAPEPDLILLDLNLPGLDGFEFLGWLRRTFTIPVLIQSAREADEDVVLGLGLGADEYISKPVSPKVLVARVRALLRRMRQKDQESLFNFGPFQLDRRACRLLHEGKDQGLSAKEYEVLDWLINHPSTAHTPQALYKGVWAQEYGDLGTVGVYIQRLRKKLELDSTAPRWIKTVRGKGYLFDPKGENP